VSSAKALPESLAAMQSGRDKETAAGQYPIVAANCLYA
jgi:hypothetical protein